MTAFQDRIFHSRREFAEHIHRVVFTLPEHQALSGDDLDFATALLHRRRDWETKAGPAGIAAIWVVSNGPGREFRFRRVGESPGSYDTFSWRKVLRGESSVLDYVTSAMRYAVNDQIWAFRDQAFAGVQLVPSALGGEMLATGQAEVDHVRPFFEIRDAWITEQGSLQAIRYSRATTARTSAVLSNPAQLRSWTAFHAGAELRIISRAENQELGRLVQVGA